MNEETESQRNERVQPKAHTAFTRNQNQKLSLLTLVQDLEFPLTYLLSYIVNLIINVISLTCPRTLLIPKVQLLHFLRARGPQYWRCHSLCDNMVSLVQQQENILPDVLKCQKLHLLLNLDQIKWEVFLYPRPNKFQQTCFVF